MYIPFEKESIEISAESPLFALHISDRFSYQMFVSLCAKNVI